MEVDVSREENAHLQFLAEKKNARYLVQSFDRRLLNDARNFDTTFSDATGSVLKHTCSMILFSKVIRTTVE